jgi:hypothetical protein
VTDVLLVVAAEDAAESRTVDAQEEWFRDEWTSGWSWSIQRLDFSVGSPADTKDSGKVGPAETELPGRLVVGWDIIPMITDVPLLHVRRPHTSAGEIAVLAAKALGKALVLSDLEARTSVVGASFGIAHLGDCLICRSDTEARDYADHPWVVVLDPNDGKSPGLLQEIYRGLLTGGENPA